MFKKIIFQCSVSDAIELCTKHAVKFISVSAVINHRVDELLVGIVCQLRHYYDNQQGHVTNANMTTAAGDKCMTSSCGLLKRLFFSKRTAIKYPCEDLMTA